MTPDSERNPSQELNRTQGPEVNSQGDSAREHVVKPASVDSFADLCGPPSLEQDYITNQKLSTDFDSRVAVIGAGSYGAAIAKVLADNGVDTAMWARREETTQSINEHNQTDKIAQPMPADIWASTDMERVLRDRGVIILAVPSYALEEIASKIKPHPDSIVINLAKGFVFEGGNPFKTPADYKHGPDPDTKVTLPSKLLENIPHWDGFDRVASVAGPGFAKNILDNTPFSLSVAAKDIELARKVRNFFQGDQARVFVNDDPYTVQIAGAMKNVIALGAGMNSGLSPEGEKGRYREEGVAMLLCRGLREMMAMAKKFAKENDSKAQYKTVVGVAGVGDLVLTATSRESRNFRMGEELGKGTPVVQAINNLNVTAEGLGNAWGAKLLADQLSGDHGQRLFTPISNAVVDIMQGHNTPSRIFDVLFRDLEFLEHAEFTGDLSSEVDDIYF